MSITVDEFNKKVIFSCDKPGCKEIKEIKLVKKTHMKKGKQISYPAGWKETKKSGIRCTKCK